MKCPRCDVELKPEVRHRLTVQTCPKCRGLWFDKAEFRDLENEAFDLDEHAKGTLVFSATPSGLKCPVCVSEMKRFDYRLYDLELDFCTQGDGYWLDAGEDDRVLDLMRKEEQDIDRSFDAEERWGAMMKHMHSGGFLEKLRDLLR